MYGEGGITTLELLRLEFDGEGDIWDIKGIKYIDGKGYHEAPAQDEVIQFVEHAIQDTVSSEQPITVQGLDSGKSRKPSAKSSGKKSSVKCPRCCATMFLCNGKNGEFRSLSHLFGVLHS